jgi:hypothetical protein
MRMMAPAKVLTTMVKSTTKSSVPGRDVATAAEDGELDAEPEREALVALLAADLVVVPVLADDVDTAPCATPTSWSRA